MNSVYRPLFATAFAALVTATAFAAEPTALAAERVKPAGLMITDLRGESPAIFAYSTWEGATVPGGSGVVVSGAKGAQGNGGLGGNLAPAKDLDGVVYVDVALGVGAANQVPTVTLALNDADGTQVSARIRVDQIVPQQPVWFQVPLGDFRVVSGYEGKIRGMDWAHVVQWHVQGDWTTMKPFHMVVIALRARR